MIKRPFEQWLYEDVEIEFGIERIKNLPTMLQWLDVSTTQDLPERFENLRIELSENVENWNEDELKMMFAYPFISYIGLNSFDGYRVFIQNNLVRNFEIVEESQETILFIAQGKQKPKPNFLFFQTFQAENGTSKDVLGQLLIAMTNAQTLNEDAQKPLYGCYIIGRLWFFVLLVGKQYAVSRAYDATQTDDMTAMIQILEKVKQHIHRELGL
ncbi:MAG: hypothetical protein EAZ95_08590 [Bacteroidetes bacterium]|nr:MAG: hypothetical protein EAZ95_08590 [Bacteroidota bacterium]